MTPARKLYLDNIRWMTVVLVVIYHVVYAADRRLRRYDAVAHGCKVKITYTEDGDSMEVLQKLIHDTLREEAKNYN